MTVSITIARNQRGDDEAHLTGCQHLTRKGLRPLPNAGGFAGSTHTGETLKLAIRAADTDMADAFGQEVYQSSPDDQAWTVAMMAAPCIRKLVPGWDTETGEPKL